MEFTMEKEFTSRRVRIVATHARYMDWKQHQVTLCQLRFKLLAISSWNIVFFVGIVHDRPIHWTRENETSDWLPTKELSAHSFKIG